MCIILQEQNKEIINDETEKRSHESFLQYGGINPFWNIYELLGLEIKVRLVR